MPPDFELLRPIASELADVVEAFRSGGFELHVVGGLVRDLVGGRPLDVADIDLATDATPEQVRTLLADHVDAMWRQGERFGTIGVVLGDRKIEVTTYRAEVYQPDSRKPVVRFSHDLATDLSRRDFTINAMAATLPDLRLVDPFDGLRDLEAGVLRTPLDPAISFDDDPLRMLRGARFLATLDLVAVDGLVPAMAQRADRLGIVSAERIGDELLKLLAVESPGRGLRLLDQAGLLEAVVPEYSGVAEARRQVDLAMVDLIEPVAALWRLAAVYAFLDPAAAGRAGARLRIARDARRRLRALTDAIVSSAELTGVDLVASRHLAASIGEERSFLAGILRARATATEASSVLADDEAARLRTAAAAVEAGWIELAGEDLSVIGAGLTGADVMDELHLQPGPDVGRALAWLEQVRYREGALPGDELRARLRAWWGDREADQ
jgi:poly(A) polymerase